MLLLIALSIGGIIFDSSDDESYVYAGQANTKIVKYSTDQGSNWFDASAGTEGQHTIVKCDSTGQYVLAYYGSGNRGVHLSTDYGISYSATLTNSVNGLASMKRDGNLIVYCGEPFSNIYYSNNQGSSWSTITNPWGTVKPFFRNDFKNNEIYMYAIGESEIYKFNKDNDGLILVKDTGQSIQVCEPSQYGRGMAFSTVGGTELYYAKNYQTFNKVYDGTLVTYIQVL